MLRGAGRERERARRAPGARRRCFVQPARAAGGPERIHRAHHAARVVRRRVRNVTQRAASLWLYSAGFLPPQAPAPFSRHPGKGKQRGALRRFDKMFDSQTSTVGSAVSTGSQFDHTPASQFSPVSPPYSQFGSTPASQSSPVSPQYSPASLSQPAPVSDRRPRKSKGPSSSA